MIETGVIHGRFQILHNDHLKYLLAGKARCQHLVVGITNPDPCQTSENAADPERSSDQANPFTYFQRYQMVRAALTGSRLEEKQFSVVPFPINFPERYQYYVPLDATFFLTIYDQWGERKLEMFQALGLTTEVLWRRTPATKGLSATDIRKKVADNDPSWQQLVPPGVAEIINRIVA
jgi:nicotinamide-nucleotide adenylyltransferase